MNIWHHGKYLDMWSLVHFLSGIMLSGIAFILLTPIPALFFVFIIAVLWEVFEAMIGIGEDTANFLTDIIIAIVGYIFTYYIYYVLGKPFDSELLVAIIVATAFLSLWGFLDMKRRQWKR